MFRINRDLLNKTREIDRGLGQYIERFSRFIWPWQEKWLMAIVASLILMDFASTFILLELSGKTNVYESGVLAFWALEIGGFPFLFLVDMLSVGLLLLAAFASRRLYAKHGFRDYGRAAFVLLLVPYIIITVYAIVNNFVLLVS